MLRTFLLASIVAAPALAWEVRKDSQGDVVRWDRRVEFVVDAHFAEQLRLPGALAAVQAAAASLNAEAPALEVTVRQGEHDGRLGYSPSGNENSILVLTEWPYEPTNLAVTLVTLNAKTNRVLDADIALNAEEHSFLIVDGPPGDQTRYDLQNTLTHELGHALGLMHTSDERAVMFPSSAPGEICKRILSQDDIAGLAELYASSPDGAPQVGCSAAPGRLPLAMLCAVVLLALKRRARLPSTCALALVVAGGASVARAAEPASAAAPEEIAWGEVVDTSSRWLPDSRVIVTDVEVEVLRCVKGACAQKRVRVQVLGGRVGDIEQVVEHQPAPRRGGQVVLTKRNGHVRLAVAR